MSVKGGEGVARENIPDGIMKSSLADWLWSLETEATDDESDPQLSLRG